MTGDIDIEWVIESPQAALDMIDRLMRQRDEWERLAKASAAAFAARPDAALREALEVVAGGEIDVSNTAIIVGHGADTVMRQVRAALDTGGGRGEA